MTANLGTFIPLQPQNPGLKYNLGHNIGLGVTGLNTELSFSPTPVYGQNVLLGHNSHQIPLSSLWGSSAIACENSLGSLSQGMWSNGTPVAFVPSSPALQNAALVNIPAAWNGTNQAMNGLAQSFATELSENNHEYVVSFDVPGINIEDLDISLAGNTILINGIRKNSHEPSSLAYSEVARGNISRAVTVPFDVSPSKAINTSLENGVLKIRIAKETQADKRTSARKVKIG